MLTKGKCIVLHSIKYGDDSNIVSVYFEQEGLLSFMTKSLKGHHNNIIRSLLQPLSVIDVEFDYRQNRRLQYFREIKPAFTMTEMYGNPYKITIAIFIAEVLRYALRGEKGNASLFAFVCNSIQWLTQCDGGFANFHIVFLAKLLTFLGYNPVYDEEFRSLALRSGLGSCGQGLDIGNIEKLIALDYDEMNLYTMNHTERDQCIDVLLKYYKLRLPEFPELKSLEVLKDVFCD